MIEDRYDPINTAAGGTYSSTQNTNLSGSHGQNPLESQQLVGGHGGSQGNHIDSEGGMAMRNEELTENLLLQIQSFKSQTRLILFFVFMCVMVIAAGCSIMLIDVMDMNLQLDKTLKDLAN